MLRPSQVFTNSKGWKDFRCHEIQYCSNARLPPTLSRPHFDSFTGTDVVSPDVGHSEGTKLLDSFFLL